MLINAHDLAARITSDTSNPVVVFDCRFDLPGPSFNPDYGRTAYNQHHIPTAIYVDLEKDLSSSITTTSGRHPLPHENDFLDLLQRWGVSENTEVVIYDDRGGMIAARLWWMLRHWAGLSHIRLLDGGFASWHLAELPIETTPTLGIPSQERLHLNAKKLFSSEQVQRGLLATHPITVLDARAHARFTGEQENVDPVAGHIPCAVNAPCSENLDSDGKFLSKHLLRRRFEQILNSIETADTPIVHSCGSGVTACHNLFAMELAGYDDSYLYAGSWSEWIRNPSRPIATGH